MKSKYEHFKATFGAKPFLPEARVLERVSVTHGPEEKKDDAEEDAPMKLGPIGTLSPGRIFDMKIASHSDFQFSAKGGDQWKGKAERYMISTVPAVHGLFHWAGRQTEPITPERLAAVIGLRLTTWDRDNNETNHTQALDGAVRGFLSSCVSGEAQTIFKQAEILSGIDAWRRLARYIDHGREIRLETLRNEVRSIRTRFAIKNLEDVIVGIARFENKIAEFVAARGKRPGDQELKSDLNAIPL